MVVALYMGRAMVPAQMRLDHQWGLEFHDLERDGYLWLRGGRTVTLAIEQEGTTLRVRGLGDPGEQWAGTIDGEEIRFGGDRLEGVGTTTVTLRART